MYGKHVISPSAVNIVQSIESHIEAYAPKTAGQKHGHLNSAVFYVLKGMATTFMTAAASNGRPAT